MVLSDQNRNRVTSLATYTLLSILAFLSVFPFLWMAISTTNTSVDIVSGKLTLGTAFGGNIRALFEQVNVPLVVGNSAKIALLTVVLASIVSSAAGYGFEMFKSRTRERLYGIMLLSMMVPFAATMIPLFMMFAKAGLMNTHSAIIVPSIAVAYFIFFFRQSASSFPRDLRDAAKMDGLKEWQIFAYIFVPAMRSTYAAAFIIIFMAAWNAYFWPLIVLQENDMKTFTLVIASLASAYQPDFGVILVATVLATLPVIALFFLMQRQFVAGMLGSVK